MEGLQNRVDSFSKSKRVKNPNKPSSNITLKWPHSSSFAANPDTLAEAGFYYNPSPEDVDNVTCFMCDKQLSDWEADDDPFDIHYEKCAHKCSWAYIRCGLRQDMDRHGRFVFPDKSRVPTSKAMEKARLETFTTWVHDKMRGHGASSKKLAKAGFVCTHNNSDDDLAMCFYCNVSLSGWDKDDDPMEEHRKRKDKSDYPCPFFPEVASSSVGVSSKPSRSTSKSKQHQDMVMPTKVRDGDSDGPDDHSDTKTPARKSRSTSGSSRKSTAKTPRARSASKSVLQEVAEEEEEEDPPSTVKKPKRTTSKPRAKSVAPDVDEDVEEPTATVKKKRTRTKSVAKNAAVEVEAEEEPPVAPPTTTKKKKATRSRSRSVAPSERTEQSEQDFEEPEVVAKKPSRSKGKAKAPVMSETEEVEVEEPAPRKSSRSKTKAAPATAKKAPSKSKSKAKAKAAEPDPEPITEEAMEPDTTEEEQELGRSRTTKKLPTTAPKTTKSKSKVAQRKEESEISQDEFGPVIEQPHFAPAATVKARSSSKPPTAKKQPPAGASALGKGKPPSARTQPTAALALPPTDDEDELGGYTSAPSSPPPPPPVDESPNGDDEEDMDMTPLVIPKRTTKPPLAATHERQESESSDSSRNAAKPKPAKSVRPSQAKKPAAGQVRASINKMQDTSHMKVVDVLSSDDDFDDAMDELLHPEPPTSAAEEPQVEEEVRVDLQAETKGKGKKGAAQAKKSLMFTTSRALLEEPATTKTRGYSSSSSAMQLTAPVKSFSQRPSPPDTPKASSPDERQPDIEAEDADVPMQEMPKSGVEESGTHGRDEDTKMEDLLPSTTEPPRTPPRPALNAPINDDVTPLNSQSTLPACHVSIKEGPQSPEIRNAELKQTQEPPFFPPLSKLPFVPIAELTEAELDMTVEEWIRYQMEVEYDKFRRDGERELQRFRKRAEEARKTIEDL